MRRDKELFLEKSPPLNLDAENAALGAHPEVKSGCEGEEMNQTEKASLAVFFTQPELLDVTAFRAEHFTDRLYCEVLRAQQFLRAKQMAVNAVTVYEYIKQTSLPDDLKSFSQIAEIETYPTASGESVLRSYERILIPPWRAHRSAAAHEKARLALLDGEDPDEVQAQFEKDIEPGDDNEPSVLIHANHLHTMPAAEMILGTSYVRGGLIVIFGPSGAYKTFLVLGHAIEISRLGETVIYWSGEGASGIRKRKEAYCDHYGTDPGELYFHFENLNLLDSGSTDRFIRQVRRIAERVSIVVIDTWARALVGGDENSARDIGVGIANVARIQRALSCGVILIHHTNRAEKGERGSGALRGAADQMLEVSIDDDLITVACSKAKDFAPFEPEYYKFVSNGVSGLLLPANRVAIDYGKLTQHQVTILEGLSLATFDARGATKAELEAVTRIPERSLYRGLSNLKGRDFIDQNRVGSRYSITLAGRDVLKLARQPLPDSVHPVNSAPISNLEPMLPDRQIPANGAATGAPLTAANSHTLKSGSVAEKVAGSRAEQRETVELNEGRERLVGRGLL